MRRGGNQHTVRFDLEQAKTVLGRHSRVVDAAAELGLTASVLTDRFRKRGSHASSFLAKVPVPEGMRVREITTRENAAGEITSRTIKADKESEDPPKFAPLPPAHLIDGMSTLMGPQGEVRAQWLKSRREKQAQWDQFWVACDRATKDYRGLVDPAPLPDAKQADLLAVYPLGDPHIGMLSWNKETGEDFDLKIATRDLFGVVDRLVDRAPPAARGVLANLGDFFHAENDDQLTPRGHNKLDVDTRMAKVAELGFATVRRLVDRLLTKHAKVTVINVRGNHDPHLALMLALWLRAIYEREPRVHVAENANPYQYLRHGRVLLGFAHGDGAKMESLGGVMAADRPEDWGSTDYRYWMTGHIHQRKLVELPGCLAESFRTLAPQDYWAHHKGYRSGQSLDVLTFHDTWGLDTRATVDLRLARGKSS